MPTNLIKSYPQLLELGHLNEYQRTQSLLNIFKRDIEDTIIYAIQVYIHTL